MLPKQNRLNKRADFSRVAQSGQTVQSKNFGLAYLDTDDKNTLPKIGFIVSNKISKKAHERNYVKRLLRQTIRELVGNIKNGLLLVLLARKSILDASSEELKRELESKLKQIEVLKFKN